MKKIVRLTEEDINRFINSYYGKNIDLQDKIDNLYSELSSYILQGKELVNKLSNELDTVTFEVGKTKISKEEKEEHYNNLDDFEHVLYSTEKYLTEIGKGIFGMDIDNN
jgi:hypothetical protein